MGPDQIRARLTDINAKLEGIQAGEEGYTEDQLTDINALSEEFDGLTGQLEAAEKVEAMKAKATTTTGRKVVAAGSTAVTRVEVSAPRNQRFGGFNSSGDFLNAVRKASTGDIDKRFQNTMFEKNGEDGGFQIPEDISDSITKKLESSESLMASANVVKVAGNTMTLNLDESQPWNQGVQAYWVGEGQNLIESKPKFTQASWRLHKLGVLVKATDELLEDNTALESYIKSAAPAAIMYKLNNAIISGDGVGKPAGLLNSPFTVTVAKEAGQAVDTIVARNIVKMYNRMIPSARGNAAWYVNIAALDQLMTMTDDNGNFIYLNPGQTINQSPYATLLGRPVIPMLSGLPTLGDSGDIVFASMDYYYMIQKASGIKSATSIHAYFEKEITAFRFTLRVDGKVPFASPVTAENGGYQISAVVKLADR